MAAAVDAYLVFVVEIPAQRREAREIATRETRQLVLQLLFVLVRRFGGGEVLKALVSSDGLAALVPWRHTYSVQVLCRRLVILIDTPFQ